MVATLKANGATPNGVSTPWSQIRDDDVYYLNPMARLRNEKDHVLAGVNKTPARPLHRTFGIVLALCNGQRTVLEIARITRPFVKVANDEEAFATARRHVQRVLYASSKTLEELRGQSAAPNPSEFPSAAIVMNQQEYRRCWGAYHFPTVDYDPQEFVPKDASEIAPGPFGNVHLSAPLNICWHVTSKCGVDCKYCYLGRRNIAPMPREKALSLVREAAEFHVLGIDLTGGDLLLYPYLFEVIREMRRCKFYPMDIISTKSYVSRRKAAKLAEHSDMIWEVQFSIDSDDDEIAA